MVSLILSILMFETRFLKMRPNFGLLNRELVRVSCNKRKFLSHFWALIYSKLTLVNKIPPLHQIKIKVQIGHRSEFEDNFFQIFLNINWKWNILFVRFFLHLDLERSILRTAVFLLQTVRIFFSTQEQFFLEHFLTRVN